MLTVYLTGVVIMAIYTIAYGCCCLKWTEDQWRMSATVLLFTVIFDVALWPLVMVLTFTKQAWIDFVKNLD